MALPPEHFADVVLGHPAEDVLHRLAVHRRRTFEVRVVGAPHEPVDADLVAHLRLVALHQRTAHVDVLLEVVTRAHA